MPQYPPPQLFPDWAEGGNALVSQPTPSQQASGFTVNQRPTAQVLNWLHQTVGRSIRWLSQGVNAVMTGASQEPSYRLIGGGMWSWNASTGVLSWSDAFAIGMPGLSDAANVVAAGSVTLAASQVAYVQSNAPFTTTGDVTSGSSNLTNLAYESGISVGETVSGTGIPSGATVVAISSTDSTVTISAPATATSSQTNLVFASSGALNVQAASINNFAPSANTVVIARCYSSNGPNQVHVGVNAGQMRLLDNESKALLGNGYTTTFRATAGVALAAKQPVYVSPGTSDGRTAGAVYPLDVSSSGSAARATFAGFAVSAAASGASCEVINAGKVAGFTGLVPGQLYYASPTSPSSIQASIPSAGGQYIVPVGTASSADTLVIAAKASSPVQPIGATLTFNGPISAPSVISGAGFKTVLDMGYWYTSNDNTTERRLIEPMYNASAQIFDYVNATVRPGSSGSFLGFCLTGSFAGSNAKLYKNDVQIFVGIISGPGFYGYDLIKGLVTFSANDELRVTFQQSTSGAVVRFRARILVELSA